jgi:hypothetical protein
LLLAALLVVIALAAFAVHERPAREAYRDIYASVPSFEMVREVRTLQQTQVFDVVYNNEDDWKQTQLIPTGDEKAPFRPGDYQRFDGRTIYWTQNGGPEFAGDQAPADPNVVTVPGGWFRTAESLMSTAGGGWNDPEHWYYELDRSPDRTLLTLYTSYDRTVCTFSPALPLPIDIREYSPDGQLVREEIATSLTVQGNKVF